MWQLLQARRGKKAAVGFIEPLVSASRRGTLTEIPERAWLTPYMVGFMAMLISLVAQRAASGLSSDVLGLVQVEAWQRITGFKQHPIGEDICLFSTDRNHEFENGCSSARRFLADLDQAGLHVRPDSQENGTGFDRTTAKALWAEYFEAHIEVNPEPGG